MEATGCGGVTTLPLSNLTHLRPAAAPAAPAAHRLTVSLYTYVKLLLLSVSTGRKPRLTHELL